MRNVREDFRHYARFCYRSESALWCAPRVLLAHPAALAVLWYRFGSWVRRFPVPLIKQLLQLWYWLWMPFVRAYSGVQLLPQTRIGPGLVILHFGGVVITRDCEIGPNCVLYHNVSLVTAKSRRGPKIGANFYAGVGTIIVGEVTIEDHVTCGAGSVVTRSVPRGAIVGGVPARILRFADEHDRFTENKSGGSKSPPEWMQAPDSLNQLAATDQVAPDQRSLIQERSSLT
ncbi:MAG: serine acetyltransferase [Phycisphaerales bacterium]|nr:serine acetyltransferase [Phycisphaerales bacterium]